MKFVVVLAACAAVVAACERRTEAPSAVTRAKQVAKPHLTGDSVSSSRAGPAARQRGKLLEYTWSYPNGPFGTMEVVVSVPATAMPGRRFPVLFAFHGRGESLKSPARGARGWIDDYGLPGAVARLSEAPPLTADDFLGFVEPAHLEGLNRRLTTNPYQGLVVVCPYLADVLRGGRAFESEGQALADFLVDTVLPRVRQEIPVLQTPAATGVDGVSLGGRAALLVGFSRPEAFGSVAAIQPAVDVGEVSKWVSLAVHAQKAQPGMRIRLLSSTEDYFLEVTRELHRAWQAVGVRSDLEVVVGPHDYAFNRGPGVYEMLLHHDVALRR